MVNEAWEDSFPQTILAHLDYYHSDHRALLIKMTGNLEIQKFSKKRKRFRFENIWSTDEECKTIIRNNWMNDDSTPILELLQNIQRCAANLTTWHQKCISSIPLSLFNHEDSWFWHYTNHGSGYNTAMTLDKSLPSSASDVFSTWWKQFWGLKIPRKILHFAWRGFHEILPTRIGLEKRKIVSNNSCELCGFGGESNAHAIFWCPFAQEIWKLLEFTFLHEVREVIDFKNVILYASEVVDKDLFEKIIISAWAIWTERNKVTHGQHLGQPQQIVNWIDSYYGTVVSARDGAKVSSLTIQRNRNNSEVLHRDPQEEQRHTILMVDAAVLNNTSSVGLGAIILSEDRRVRAAVCKPLKGFETLYMGRIVDFIIFGVASLVNMICIYCEEFYDNFECFRGVLKSMAESGQLGRFSLCLWTFLCLPPPDSFYSYSYSSDGDSDDSSTTVISALAWSRKVARIGDRLLGFTGIGESVLHISLRLCEWIMFLHKALKAKDKRFGHLPWRVRLYKSKPTRLKSSSPSHSKHQTRRSASETASNRRCVHQWSVNPDGRVNESINYLQSHKMHLNIKHLRNIIGRIASYGEPLLLK
ncbi:hypothetical protein F8388_006147 [Cannabis sativa]|uniref:Reverse transcriptase zinc-binding domain-containing protein n=1 Tax=Cannabis sativa TaxID=3483 RepID=A0A7J6G6S5_CANSA|nr:hypothetical protein F8388_006147 [Cannabis sativa]